MWPGCTAGPVCARGLTHELFLSLPWFLTFSTKHQKEKEAAAAKLWCWNTELCEDGGSPCPLVSVTLSGRSALCDFKHTGPSSEVALSV